LLKKYSPKFFSFFFYKFSFKIFFSCRHLQSPSVDEEIILSSFKEYFVRIFELGWFGSFIIKFITLR